MDPPELTEFLNARHQQRLKQHELERAAEEKDYLEQEAAAKYADAVEWNKLCPQPSPFDEPDPFPDDFSEVQSHISEADSDVLAKEFARVDFTKTLEREQRDLEHGLKKTKENQKRRIEQWKAQREALKNEIRNIENERDEQLIQQLRASGAPEKELKRIQAQQTERMLERESVFVIEDDKELKNIENEFTAIENKLIKEINAFPKHRRNREKQWELQWKTNRLRERKGKQPVDWEQYDDYLDRRAAYDTRFQEMVESDAMRRDEFLKERADERYKLRQALLQHAQLLWEKQELEMVAKDREDWYAGIRNTTWHPQGLNSGLTAYTTSVDIYPDGHQCNDSKRLVQLLQDMQLPFAEVDLAKSNIPSSVVRQASGEHILPQLFIGNEFVGLWPDVWQAHQNNTLHAHLERVLDHIEGVPSPIAQSRLAQPVPVPTQEQQELLEEHRQRLEAERQRMEDERKWLAEERQKLQDQFTQTQQALRHLYRQQVQPNDDSAESVVASVEVPHEHIPSPKTIPYDSPKKDESRPKSTDTSVPLYPEYDDVTKLALEGYQGAHPKKHHNKERKILEKILMEGLDPETVDIDAITVSSSSKSSVIETPNMKPAKAAQEHKLPEPVNDDEELEHRSASMMVKQMSALSNMTSTSEEPIFYVIPNTPTDAEAPIFGLPPGATAGKKLDLDKQAEERAERAYREEQLKKEEATRKKQLQIQKEAFEREQALKMWDALGKLARGEIQPNGVQLRSIIKIQAVMRGRLGRKRAAKKRHERFGEEGEELDEIDEYEAAAIILQSIWRGRQDRKMVKEMKWQKFKDEHDKAQRVWEAKKAKEKAELERQALERKLAEERAVVRMAQAAAILIQSKWRGHYVRSHWPSIRRRVLEWRLALLRDKWTKATIVLQAAWRMYDTRLAIEEMHSSATRLQSWWRGVLDRIRTADIRRAQWFALCATRIQTAWRGFHARRKAATLRGLWLLRNEAAVAIQAWHRGNMGRRRARIALQAWLERQNQKLKDQQQAEILRQQEAALLEAQRQQDEIRQREVRLQEHRTRERQALEDLKKKEHALTLEKKQMEIRHQEQKEEILRQCTKEKFSEFDQARIGYNQILKSMADDKKRMEQEKLERARAENELRMKELELAEQKKKDLEAEIRNRKRMEEEKERQEAALRDAYAENLRLEQQKAQLEAERKKYEAERRRLDEIRKEEERQRTEAARRAKEDEMRRLERERKRLEEERIEQEIQRLKMEMLRRQEEERSIEENIEKRGRVQIEDTEKEDRKQIDADFQRNKDRLQRAYRIEIERKRREAAAKVIQRAVRCYFARRELERRQNAWHIKRYDAAVKIQSLWRGFKVRYPMKRNKERRKRIMMKCAIKIQAWIRGTWTRRWARKARKERKIKRWAATTIQKMWKGWHCRCVVEGKMDAATTIQAAVRGLLARRLLQRLKYERILSYYREKESSIIKIQAWWRGWIAREWFKYNRVYLEIARARRTVRKTITLLGPNDALNTANKTVPWHAPIPRAVTKEHTPVGKQLSQSHPRRKLPRRDIPHNKPPPRNAWDTPQNPTHPHVMTSPNNISDLDLYNKQPRIDKARTGPISPIRAASAEPNIRQQGLGPAPNSAPGRVRNSNSKSWNSQQTRHDSLPLDSTDFKDPRSMLVEEIKQRKARIDQLRTQLANRIDGKVYDEAPHGQDYPLPPLKEDLIRRRNLGQRPPSGDMAPKRMMIMA